MTATEIARDRHLDELRALCPAAKKFVEAGGVFYLLPDFALPGKASPARCDMLLCATPRDGYDSRLFFAQKVQGPQQLNWNSEARISERNWFAYSWRTMPGLRPMQQLAVHLRALR